VRTVLFNKDGVRLSRKKAAAALLNKDGVGLRLCKGLAFSFDENCVRLYRSKVAGFFLFKKNREPLHCGEVAAVLTQ
jgi:hypothetical protein